MRSSNVQSNGHDALTSDWLCTSVVGLSLCPTVQPETFLFRSATTSTIVPQHARLRAFVTDGLPETPLKLLSDSC